MKCLKRYDMDGYVLYYTYDTSGHFHHLYLLRLSQLLRRDSLYHELYIISETKLCEANVDTK